MESERLNRWLTLGANLGVLVGLILLIFEMHQNTELMRAQTHSARAQAKAGRQMDIANNGILQAVRAKAADAGFPDDPNALADLNTEEVFRLREFYKARIDMIANWHFQCEQGLLAEDTCATMQRGQIAGILVSASAVGTNLKYQTPSFIKEVQRIAAEENLPTIDDGGVWID